MSNSKNYNSIVFLTTLSVYLGLVLVGATPPVMTHAALTRNFDVREEIESKDDLDKKPDDKSFEDASEDDFPALFTHLLREIKSEVKLEKISLPLQTEFYVDGKFERSRNAGGAGLGSTVSDKDLNLIFQNAVNQRFQPKALQLADADNDKGSKAVKIRVEANADDFSLKISFGKSNAEQFAAFLNREFSSSAASVQDVLLKQAYENTEATAGNNQVFVVTRLPRASIDALLAEK